ncbi:UNVERIFIED_CONTAM: ribosome biogenesis GTPase YqeH [Brevibacillus sp. OAP136]
MEGKNIAAEQEEHTLSCAGCGIHIQTIDKTKPGFTPKSALEREVIICQRCFKIKHYNEVSPVDMSDDDFLRILNGIGGTKSLVVMVVDVFDFQGSWLRGLPRFVGNNPILLVGNKVDLLPKNINLNRVRNWIQHEAKERGLRSEDVLLVSAQKGAGIEELLARIGQLRKGRDVYIVGVTNVGKSTLINRILHDYGAADLEITTSPFPGTTLDKIEIPLEDGRYIYDTPGIINRDQIGHMVHSSRPARIDATVADQSEGVPAQCRAEHVYRRSCPRRFRQRRPPAVRAVCCQSAVSTQN